MKIMSRKLALALALMAGTLIAGGAEAAVISIVPNALAVSVGDSVALDLVVSGLGGTEAVGGVSLRLTGDASILNSLSFTLDPQNKMGAELDFGSGFGPNFLDLVFVAADFGSNNFATLKGLQGSE